MTGNYERRSCFVYENRVNLIDYCKIVPALHEIFSVGYHVIAQIVESEFVICSVGYIAVVSSLLLRARLIVYDKTGGETKVLVDTSHLFAADSCKIIIDGDNVHTLSGKRIEIRRKNGNEGLSFTCLHLRNPSLMQKKSAYELYFERTFAENSVRCLAYKGKCIRQNGIQFFAVGDLFFEFESPFRHLSIRKLSIR